MAKYTLAATNLTIARYSNTRNHSALRRASTTQGEHNRPTAFQTAEDFNIIKNRLSQPTGTSLGDSILIKASFVNSQSGHSINLALILAKSAKLISHKLPQPWHSIS
jgi:hypothetical protein